MSSYVNFSTEWYTVNKLWLIGILATTLVAILTAFVYSNYFNKSSNSKSKKESNNNKSSISSKNKHENQSWFERLFEFKNTFPYTICQRMQTVKEGNNSLPDVLNDATASNTIANSNIFGEDMDAVTLDDDTGRIHIEGLVSKLKMEKLKRIKAQFTKSQLEDEKRIEREQLAAIFELLKQQEQTLNVREIDKQELNAQLRLYR